MRHDRERGLGVPEGVEGGNKWERRERKNRGKLGKRRTERRKKKEGLSVWRVSEDFRKRTRCGGLSLAYNESASGIAGYLLG